MTPGSGRRAGRRLRAQTSGGVESRRDVAPGEQAAFRGRVEHNEARLSSITCPPSTRLLLFPSANTTRRVGTPTLDGLH